MVKYYSTHSSSPQSRSKAVGCCGALAHLGCTREAGTNFRVHYLPRLGPKNETSWYFLVVGRLGVLATLNIIWTLYPREYSKPIDPKSKISEKSEEGLPCLAEEPPNFAGWLCLADGFHSLKGLTSCKEIMKKIFLIYA